MRTIIISVFVLLFLGCGQDEFDSYLTPQTADDIIEVSLYPNSPVLIADGKAQLTFKIRAYTETEGWKAIAYTEDGITLVRDSTFTDTVSLNSARIPEDKIRIIASNGETIKGRTFSTTAPAGELSFTCQIGDITSRPCQIKLIKPGQSDFTPLSIPVVFHVLYTSKTQSIAEGINEKFVNEILDRMNQVFAGTFAPAPSSLDTKVTFVPQNTDNNGMQLQEKGIHRENVSNQTNLTKYILSNLIWTPEKILNIWIYETTSGATSKNPAYVLNNGTEISGLNLKAVTDPSEIEIKNPQDAGIIIPIYSIFGIKRGTSDTRFEYLFGKFFGLMDTQEQGSDTYDGNDTDYCSDTYVPKYGPIGISKQTAVIKGSTEEPIYYNSYNIMDPYSASTTITYEQALRIRQVMENCPLRMMRK